MPLAAGTRLGVFEVLAPIGAGGMGEVYRARDTKLDRDVAIKVLPSHLNDRPDRLARFEREAKAVAALSHPNILAIHDFGEEGGVTYAVTELLEGETVRERLREGPLPVRKAIEYAVQIARGLAAAHEKGIIHRDLKPDNVFITKDGHVKILDFGLAKVVEVEGAGSEIFTNTDATEPGAVMGTVGYMSPEQVKGEPANPGSDIFAFGAILFEMLTGTRAFKRDTSVETLNAILKEEPPELTQTERPIPPGLDRIIRHCLEKRPEERFRSARDLAFDLESMSDLSTVTTAIGTATPRPRVHLYVTIALGVTTIVLATLLYLKPVARDLSAFRYTPFATDAKDEARPMWSPDGRSIAYEKGPPGKAQVFVRSLDTDSPIQITQGSGACCPIWSADGDRIWFWSRGGAWSVGRAGGEPELGQKPLVLAATVSPDGETLATWRPSQPGSAVTNTVWLASPPTAEPRKYSPSPLEAEGGSKMTWMRFSPDGTSILVTFQSTDGNQVWLLPFPDGAEMRGEPRQLFVEDAPWVEPPHISWMPDSRQVVMSVRETSLQRRLWIADLKTERLERLTAGVQDEAFPDVSPDGSKVVFTQGQMDFDLVEVPLDGSPLRKLIATSRQEHSGAWVPGADRLVYLTDRNGGLELRVRSATEEWDRSIVTSADFPDDPSLILFTPVVSPDGERVAYDRRAPDGNTAVWISPLGGGAPVRLLPDAETDSQNATWSPNGRWVAFRQLAAGVHSISKVRMGSSEPPVVLVEDGPAGVPAWSPTGEWIAYPNREGVNLLSADGESKRLLTDRLGGPLVWSRDGRNLYALAGSEGASWRVAKIDIATGGVEFRGSLAVNLRFKTPETRGLRLTLAPDGASFSASIEESNGDLWIIEGFNERKSFFDWLR